MKWTLRLLAPLGLLAAILLNRFGIIKASGLIWFFALAEAAFSLFVIITIVRAIRAARWSSAADSGPYLAIVSALSQVMPRRVAALVAMEPFLYWDFLQLVARRRKRAEGTEFRVGGLSWAPILALMWMLTPVELFLWELLIPWTWLRVLLFIAGVWSVLYITAIYASVRTHPHLLQPDGLRLRYGRFFDTAVPLASLRAASLVRGVHAPKRSWGVVHDQSEAAFLPGSEEPNVVLTLEPSIAMGNLGDDLRPVRTLYLCVDNAARFVEAVRKGATGQMPA